MRIHVLLAFVLIAATAGVAHADGVGFRRLTLGDVPARPLEAAVWYPTRASQPATLLGDNAAFVGEFVIPNAPVAPGRHRLVVLSHGYSGNLGNQAWLAAALARDGYVVAAVNHPGTTSRNRDPQIGALLWERPHDLSRLIDEVVRDPTLSVDADKVGVVGHSLGGWTAMAIAGARFDPARFAADCAVHAELAACEIYAAMNAGSTAEARTLLSGNLADPRIGAAVALDLGLARGFTPESLAALKVQVLVMSAGEGDEQVPAALESRYLASHLAFGTARYVALPGATHFSFLPVCKPEATTLLEAETPGEGLVCRNGTAAEGRAALHKRAATEILRFLDAALGAP